MKRQSGFTLLEMLVVTGLIALLGVVFSSSFFSILKGTSKATVTTEVRQNGDYALSVMEQLIRNAKPTPSCGGSFVTITGNDGGVTTFACTTGVGGKLTSNSSSLTTTSVRVLSCSFNCLPASAISPAGVSLSFTLSQNTPLGVSPRPQEQSTQSFQTTVFQRNY